MTNTELLITGIFIGCSGLLVWMWWKFKNAPLIDDEDYEDWNGR